MTENARDRSIAKKNIIVTPDLMEEIISEATEESGRTTKSAAQGWHGVQEYRIGDPLDRSFEVSTRADGCSAAGKRFTVV